MNWIKRFLKQPYVTVDRLDDELFKWTKSDPYRLRDLLKSVLCLGATGSGKTSAVARWFLAAIVRHARSSVLLHCAKPDDVRDARKIYRDADREHDLLVFEPGPAGKLRFNVIDYIMRSGGDARQVTKCLMSIAETLRSSDSNGGEDSQFWEREQERLLYNAVIVMKLATGRVSAPELQEFITGAANTPQELLTDTWRNSPHRQCLLAAHCADKTPVELLDFKGAKNYWLREFPNMADRTRSSITVGVNGLLHQFNTGMVRELLSGTTNVTPLDMLDKGKSVIVNAPPAMYGDSGAFINAAWKFATQWTVLRRDAKPTDFFNVIFADEAQQFFNGMDPEYLSHCRSHLGCMIFFSQSRHAFYAAMPGETGKHRADGLFANFNLKIACALASPLDAEWFSDLCGRELKTFNGGSIQPPESMFDEMMGRSRFNGSFSTHFERIIEPAKFMHDLRTGGAANRFVVDAIAIKTGEPFSDGRNWHWTSFSQR